LRNPASKETLLARFLAKVQNDYDLIMIDCAPTDSMLTDAAYQCSRYVVVPIKAEFLASIGFPLLHRSLQSFRIRHDDHEIDILGLVLNDYNRNDKRENRLAREDLEKQAKTFGWHIFENGIPHSDSYLRSAREGLAIDHTKGTHSKVKFEFEEFATEFFGRLGL
jgi:chromosome partitioning protein